MSDEEVDYQQLFLRLLTERLNLASPLTATQQDEDSTSSDSEDPEEDAPLPVSPHQKLLHACLGGDLDEVRHLASYPSVSIPASPEFLHAAVKRNHVDVIEFLLKEGADKDAPHNYEQKEHSPLYIAFLFNHFEVFTLLLNSGADISLLLKTEPHILNLAATRGQLNFLELFVREGLDVNTLSMQNTTPLFWAKESLEIAEFLVQNGADVNARNEENATPLHAACKVTGKDKSSAVVDFLIKSGAAVDAKDNSGATPLHVASSKGNLQIMKSLLSAGADVNALNNVKRTPLHLAVYEKQPLEVIQFLLESGVDVWAKEGDDGVTAVEIAMIQDEDEAIVKTLLSSAPPIPQKSFSKFSFLLAFLALKNYTHEVLKGLITAGLDIDETINEDTGNTLLHCAVLKGSMTFVETLVTAGANVDVLNNSVESPVELALEEDLWDIAEYLLERSSVEDQDSPIFDQGLMDALYENRFSLARLLIQHGANPNYVQRMTGMTFLQVCATSPQAECLLDAFRFLLSEGADPDAIGFVPVPPLQLAALRSDLPMVKALVESGAKVNLKGQEGDTAFLVACRKGQLPLLNFLIESGANVFETYNNKTSALHLASKYGRLEAMKILVSKGLDINAPTALPEAATPLHFAAGANFQHFTKELERIPEKEEREKYIQIATANGMYLPYGCPPAARLLVELGAEVNVLDGKGRSALHFFCAHGDLPTSTFLVQNGAKVDDASFTRGSPLHFACEGGHFPLVKFLLSNGADLKAKNARGDSLAATAALGGHWSLLPLLGVHDPVTLPLQMAASRGELPTEVPPELVDSLGVLGYSALHFGALNGHLSVVHSLLRLGANATLKGTNEHVIHSAIRGKNVDVVRLVLEEIMTFCEENGGSFAVELNRREDSAGESPLMTAVRSGRLEMVMVLVVHEAVDRNLQNEYGLTALHIAAEENLTDIAELLITFKVDGSLRDNFGRTPTDIAKQNENDEMLEFLPKVVPHSGRPVTSRQPLSASEPREKKPAEASSRTVERDGEDSSGKKEKSSCLSAIFCCFCSSKSN